MGGQSVNRSKTVNAWESEMLVREADLSWAAWIQGFFLVGADSDRSEDRVWKRNYQELYTRDVTLSSLGDVAGKDGLDVAGGSGDYGIVLGILGARMKCQDLSEESVAVGRERCDRVGLEIDFRVGDAQDLQFDDESVDFVLSTDFFEHITLEQKRKVVSEIYRVLRPGGLFVLKTPNLTYLRIVIAIKRLVAVFRLRSPILHIAHTRENPDSEHHGLTTFREMETILQEHFFVSTERVPLTLRRQRIPSWAGRLLYGRWSLTEHIIIRSRKSVFMPISDRL